MAEMLQELQELETQFFEIRTKLRHLKGKVGLFQSIEHEPVDSISLQSADNRAAHDMLVDINYALMRLDQYEYQRDYWFERASGFEKITKIFESQQNLPKHLKNQ